MTGSALILEGPRTRFPFSFFTRPIYAVLHIDPKAGMTAVCHALRVLGIPALDVERSVRIRQDPHLSCG